MHQFVMRAKQEIPQDKENLFSSLHLPPVMERLLVLRGYDTLKKVEKFLYPSSADLYDPFLLANMDRAVARLEEALKNKENCVVYGDYDADGVTATALLMMHLKSLGLSCTYYIPDRHYEGYGLNEDAIKSLAQSATLLITVDCGITSLEEIALARSLGMDVVVTDHHLPPSVLPDVPCVNPHLGDYPFRYLSGVGTAFKLVQALSGKQAALQYVDLVAVGTICDIVSLTDENRALVSLGLAAINKQARPGIRALLDACGYAKDRAVDSGMISYGMGPRINAGGRIGHSAGSVNMLMETDYALAKPVAQTLVEQNQERQNQETHIMEEALTQIQEKLDVLSDRILILYGDNWNPGVIGIVASRLVERYHFPVILLAKEGDTYTGSGRSVEGVHILKLISSAQDLLVRFGGHEMACGLKIKRENIALFSQRLQDALADTPQEVYIPKQSYDLKVTLQELTLDLTRQLERLQPFGQGNPNPVFLVEQVKPWQVRKIGKNNDHLRMQLQKESLSCDAIAFREAQNFALYMHELDMLVVPERNVWMEKEQLQLRICAAELSGAVFEKTLKECEDKNLREFLRTLRLQNEPAKFRRDVPIKDAQSGQAIFLHLLKQSAFGTLLVVNRWESARDYLSFARKENLPLAYSLESPPDTELPYNRVVLSGSLRAGFIKGYRHILFCDGVPDQRYVERLLSAAPQAVVYAGKLTQSMRAALLKQMPDLSQLRLCYRVLQQERMRLSAMDDFETFYKLVHDKMDITRTCLHICLTVFQDAHLVLYRAWPLRFTFLPQGKDKVDLFETPAMLYLKTITKGLL